MYFPLRNKFLDEIYYVTMNECVMRNFSVLKERFFANHIASMQRIFVNSKLELVSLSTLIFPEAVYIKNDSREIVSINYSIYSSRFVFSVHCLCKRHRREFRNFLAKP